MKLIEGMGDILAGIFSPLVAWNKEKLRDVIREERFAAKEISELRTQLRWAEEENEKLLGQLAAQKGQITKIKNKIFKRLLSDDDAQTKNKR